MPTIQLKDGNGTLYHFEVSGDGSAGNPFVPLSDLSVSGAPVNNQSPLPVMTPDGHGFAIKDVLIALKNIFNVLARPLWVDPGTSRVKADVVVSSGTITTCSTVTSLLQLAGFDTKQTLLYSTDRNLWANAVRTRIT